MSGIFGVIGKKDCGQDLFYGTDYHSHLGTQFAGVAVFGNEFVRKIHGIAGSQFKSKFFDDFRSFSGNKGIGVISAHDEQPLYINSRFGPFAIVTNGFIDNADELSRMLFDEGQSFSEIIDGKVNLTELAAKLIIRGKDMIDGIDSMFSLISGSCSLLILTPEGIYAARDRHGYFPLILGRKDGAVAVTTETAAFYNLGFSVTKYLQPGEIVMLGENGAETKHSGNGHTQVCSFLWIYTGFPASAYEGINAEIVRENSGRALAKNDGIKADLVAGVPDSGIAHAIGYAMGSGVPYRRVLIKYTPGYGRSYTPPSQETRALVAHMKLIPVPDIIRDARIVVCDDSIVRGTQCKNFTINKLKNCGAKEIHLRIACPPLLFPCKFNFSTRSLDELIARRGIRALEGRDLDDVAAYVDENTPQYRRLVDWICGELGAASLKYQKLDDMVAAIGLPKEKLCTYCWTGKGFSGDNGCSKLCKAKSRKSTAGSSV